MTTTIAPLRADAQVIGLIGFGHGVSHFYQLALPAIFPWLKAEFGVSYAALGFVMTVFFAISGICQAGAGFLVDHYGARRVLLAGMATMVAGALLATLADGYAFLLVGAALIGLGNSVLHPADYAVLNARVSIRRLGHAFSVHGLSGYLGYAIAPPFMYGIANVAGWRVALALATAVGAVMLLVILAMPSVFDTGSGRSDRQAAAEGAAPRRFAWVTWPVVLCFLFFVFATTSGTGLQNFAPQLLSKLHGLELTAAAGVLTAYLLCAALGMAAGGFVAGATGRHELQAGGALLLAGLALAMVALVDLPLWAVLPLMCLAGFLMGLVGPARDMLVRKAAARGASGRVFGVVYSGIDAGAALGPLLVGLYLDAGRPVAALLTLGLILAIAAAVSIGIAARLRLAERPGPAPTQENLR